MWIELQIVTTAENAFAVSDQLENLGALAVTMNDAGSQPIYEPPLNTIQLWPETRVTGLFGQDQDMDPILSYFQKNYVTEIKYLEEQDWVRKSQADFKPLRFGQRLWVCPSWDITPAADRVNIILDPGVAFGTGSHPTTALCLEWLDKNVSSQNLILDYGCGSGILSLAALKLGVLQAIAVDHDPQALSATQENCRRNDIDSSRLRALFPQQVPVVKADIIIANILSKPLIDLEKTFNQLLAPKGKIAFSGLLNNQADTLREAYSAWVEFDHFTVKNEWVCLAGNRK